MGLFGKLKKKKEEPAPSAEEVCTAGWDAIEQEFLRVYPGQDKPKHYGTIIKWILGGNDPLDGLSVYDGGDFWHFLGSANALLLGSPAGHVGDGAAPPPRPFLVLRRGRAATRTWPSGDRGTRAGSWRSGRTGPT